MAITKEKKKLTRLNGLKMNVRPETIKLQEENTGSTLFAVGLNNVFLSIYPQAKEIKNQQTRLHQTKKLHI